MLTVATAEGMINEQPETCLSSVVAAARLVDLRSSSVARCYTARVFPMKGTSMKPCVAKSVLRLLALACLCSGTIAHSSVSEAQTIAAGKSQTNLATETVWPGAQDPPYICCWSKQGQYVTFSFQVPAGQTNLTLRYSAGNSASTRKIELDGAVFVANETFPRTPNWSTWTTLTLSPMLTNGTHTLTIIFDSTSGSAGYINLDNLTVTAATVTPPGEATQTIAAGTSLTNIATETVWPGAQNPPYSCCWSKQGQFVTFAFDVPAGKANLALRYSAGSSASTRKIELDGAVLVADETFPRTPNWSTWATLTLSPTLTSGTHTLTVIFDTTSASAGYINLDNLSVVSNAFPSQPGVSVALGYADGLTGPQPWSGAANTIFLGTSPQCCLTHGPNNGSFGYDGGAIEITNTSTAAVTVNAVTADFGGGSNPSHFDLWSSQLPKQLPPGNHLILAMNSNFNFDTSDLFGEACHVNSGVVPIVHITVNSTLTDYLDEHEILNSDGADLASCPGDVSEAKPFTPVTAGPQTVAAAVNEVAPSTTGTAITGRVLSGFAGGWNASSPPTIGLQWTRCDSAGGNCVAISGATTATYRPTSSDVGSTLRLQVTASNPSGKVTVSSTQTNAIIAGPTVAQMGDTSTGFTSTYSFQATQLSSISSAPSSGTTAYFEFFARGAAGTQTFTPQIYSVVAGSKGSLLGTGTTLTVPEGADGRWYVATLSGVKLTAGTQYVLALNPSGVKSTYVGSETNGTMSFFVDYSPGN